MSVVRLTLAYEGGGFTGWARQPGLRTVEGELGGALERILGEPVSLSVAGRTDAGVHAWGQVASFEHPGELPERLAERVNAVGPADVAVLGAESAAERFDARRDACARTYCYRILASPVRSPFEEGRALWWRQPLDVRALGGCAAALHGTHDFTAFTPTDTDHVRFERDVLRAEWVWERRHCADPPIADAGASEHQGQWFECERAGAEQMGGMLCFWIEADAFMRHMVRVLVGTMLEVGSGRHSLMDFKRLLEGMPREEAGETAPAHGLYLASVRY